jgi:hypothetical protein
LLYTHRLQIQTYSTCLSHINFIFFVSVERQMKKDGIMKTKSTWKRKMASLTMDFLYTFNYHSKGHFTYNMILFKHGRKELHDHSFSTCFILGYKRVRIYPMFCVFVCLFICLLVCLFFLICTYIVFRCVEIASLVMSIIICVGSCCSIFRFLCSVCRPFFALVPFSGGQYIVCPTSTYGYWLFNLYLRIAFLYFLY